MKTTKQRFAGNLKFLRKRDGMSQEYTAKKLGIKRSAYSHYECANIEPGFDLLLKMCRLFKTTPTMLIDRDLSINDGVVKDLKKSNPETIQS